MTLLMRHVNEGRSADTAAQLADTWDDAVPPPETDQARPFLRIIPSVCGGGEMKVDFDSRLIGIVQSYHNEVSTYRYVDSRR
jgi:hypothetical protein